MTTAHLDLATDHLEPLRLALLDAARTDAAELLAAADTEAEEIVAAARVDDDTELRRATERARAAARARSERRLDRARAEAREQILRARAEIVDRLVAATHERVRDLVTDPRYPDLLDALGELARHQLGAEATIEPADDVGGLTAHHGDRRVDYTLPALADRALATLGDEVEELWR